MLAARLLRGARGALRSATPVAKRRLSLPPHNVVSVPALSPTMETGTIARWHIEEGQAFGAGDSIAEVETDKASMEWEMQDDGVVAKHLVQPGTEVAVGTPAVVLVEDASDVGAFADFLVWGIKASPLLTDRAVAIYNEEDGSCEVFRPRAGTGVNSARFIFHPVRRGALSLGPLGPGPAGPPASGRPGSPPDRAGRAPQGAYPDLFTQSLSRSPL